MKLLKVSSEKTQKLNVIVKGLIIRDTLGINNSFRLMKKAREGERDH